MNSLFVTATIQWPAFLISVTTFPVHLHHSCPSHCWNAQGKGVLCFRTVHWAKLLITSCSLLLTPQGTAQSLWIFCQQSQASSCWHTENFLAFWNGLEITCKSTCLTKQGKQKHNWDECKAPLSLAKPLGSKTGETDPFLLELNAWERYPVVLCGKETAPCYLTQAGWILDIKA